MILVRTEFILHSSLALIKEASTKWPWLSEHGSSRTSRSTSHLAQFMSSMTKSLTSTIFATRRVSTLGKFPVHRVTTPRMLSLAGVVRPSQRSSQTKASSSARAFPVDAVRLLHQHLRRLPHHHHHVQTIGHEANSPAQLTKEWAIAARTG